MYLYTQASERLRCPTTLAVPIQFLQLLLFYDAIIESTAYCNNETIVNSVNEMLMCMEYHLAGL